MSDVRQELFQAFPELANVGNKAWVDKACAVWEEVFKRSKWLNLAQARFNPAAPGIGLVNHTKAVLTTALGLCRNIRECHGEQIPIDLDVLTIACVLHDVDKLMFIEPAEGGGYTYSDVAHTYQHGFYSAYYAELVGLPPEIVTLLIAHTAASRVPMPSVEGLIMIYADLSDADLCKYINGQQPSLMKDIGKTPMRI